MSDRLQELNRLIAEERAGYTELITLLEQEQRELISGTAHKLEALAQQKAIVLQELDALAQQRGDHMRVLGMVSLNAWRAWLASLVSRSMSCWALSVADFIARCWLANWEAADCNRENQIRLRM